MLSQKVLLCTSTACKKYLNAALAANVISNAYSNPNTNCTEGPLDIVVVYASCTKYISLKVKIVKSAVEKKKITIIIYKYSIKNYILYNNLDNRFDYSHHTRK